MTFDKRGDRIYAINADGKTIAYIEKNRFGTHGHWRGWNHYVYDNSKGDFLWAGVYEILSDLVPCIFMSIKEFKAYYEAIN